MIILKNASLQLCVDLCTIDRVVPGEAHHQNDLAIERCYRSKPFDNDEERLEYLFKLYEKMIAEEEAK